MMFSTDACPFCHLLREDFLQPMLLSGDYAQRIIMVEIDTTRKQTLIDFQGKQISIKQLRQRYHIRLFPTIVFVNAPGQSLVENIEGVTTPSMFGGTLDDAIEQALSLLRL